MKKKKVNKNALIWLSKKIKSSIPSLFIIIVLNVVSSVLVVNFALGTQSVIDTAAAGDFDKFISATINLFLLIAGVILCNFLSSYFSTGINFQLDRSLKKQMMHIILRADYKQITKYHSGDLVHRLNVDVGTIVGGVIGVTSNFATLIVRTVAVIFILAKISPIFTLGMLALCICVSGCYLLMRGTIKSYNKKVNEASGKISGFLQEITEKLLIVKALGVINKVEEKEEALLENRWSIQKKFRKFSLMSSTGMSVLSFGISFIALVFCAYQLMLGNISFGMLTAMTSLVSQLTLPIYMLPGLINQLIGMSASSERLMEVENLSQRKEKPKLDVNKNYNEFITIEGRDLCFSYDRDPVINNANFQIPKNKLTVIMGASGIGKSTLLKILLDIYKPDSGQIVFKCKNKTVDTKKWTRGMFSYVPQENLLLSGTIRENITLVRPNATDKEIEEALYIAAMDEYVAGLPQGLDTYLGENGSGISEGQAQRLSLARAVISNAPILLLDEVTSALDAETEKTVLKRIRNLKNHTCIAVTHRPAVLELADWLIEVDKNNISCKEISSNTQVSN